MEEIWKDVNGYEGKYQVSNLGNVKSLNYKGKGIERNISQIIGNRGYKVVNLYKNGKRKSFLVHRLVGNAFLENTFGHPEINHIDENKLNNMSTNLEWCTGKENREKWYINNKERLYEISYKKDKKIRHRRCEAYKYKNKVVQIDMNGNEINIFDSLLEIKKQTDYDVSNILKNCKGERKSAYGYKWEFTK